MSRFKNRFYKKLKLGKEFKEIMRLFKKVKKEMLKDCTLNEAGK